MEYLEYILAIVSGICVCIPVVQKLIITIQKYYKEKNWPALMNMLTGYMREAEILFDNGADRKEYCLMMIEQSAVLVNYDVDIEVVKKMIDDLCAMSKVVNAENKEIEEK